MAQPTIQIPPEPLEIMDPDDLDRVPEAYRSDVTDAVHPFAGLGLHPDCSRKDRWVVAGLALLFAVYARVAGLQARIDKRTRN